MLVQSNAAKGGETGYLGAPSYHVVGSQSRFSVAMKIERGADGWGESGEARPRRSSLRHEHVAAGGPYPGGVPYRVSQACSCGLRRALESIMIVITLGLPLAKAFSSAGRISSGFSQKKPRPPNPSITFS